MSYTFTQRLAQEWATISQRHLAHQHLGSSTLEEIITALHVAREGSVAERDQILYPLIQLSHQGDSDAQRLLIQAFIPKAKSFTRSVTALIKHTGNDTDEALSVAVAALWDAVRAYPLERTQNVAGWLTLRALRTLARLRCHDQESTCASASLEDLDHLQEVGHPKEPALSYEDNTQALEQLIHLFEWAIDHRAITQAEAAFLGTYTLRSSAQDKQNLATELKISVNAIHRRASYIRKKLQKLVKAEGFERADLVLV